jgi:hypothetical protein
MSEAEAGGEFRSAAGRFRPGQSGNPGGRPKHADSKPASAFDIMIGRMLSVSQSGVRRALSVDEALQLKTYQEAIKGSRPARRAILKMIARREQAIAARAPKAARVERRIEPTDPRNADAVLLMLGIARPDERWAHLASDRGDERPPRLVLEPWAVEAAEARRDGPIPTAGGEA